MIESGFFNAVADSSGAYDRVYNAETFNTFFEGIISPYGVFTAVDDEMEVLPSGSGLTVNVGPGKALVNNHWVRNTSTESLTLDAADVVLNRYDAIVLRLDSTARTLTLTKIKGTAASSPSRPAIVRNTTTKDLLLAYVYVAAGATTLTSAAITDMRNDDTVCGYVKSLINRESAYVQQYRGSFTTISVTNTIPITLDGYTYSPADVFIFNINGVMLVEGEDYTLTGSGSVVTLNTTLQISADNVINALALKTIIEID